MSFTVDDVLVEVREQMLDTLGPQYRYSDDFIVRKINQSLKRMLYKRPDLFTQVSTITCVAGSLQSAPIDSYRLFDVLSTTNGSTPKQINQDVLDMLSPAWEAQGAGATINWMRYPRDPNRFYVYPPASLSDTLRLLYAQTPPQYELGEVIVLQDAYMPLVIDGTCWLLESIDAEHVESGRAQMFKTSFDEGLDAGMMGKAVSDTDQGGSPSPEDK